MTLMEKDLTGGAGLLGCFSVTSFGRAVALLGASSAGSFSDSETLRLGALLGLLGAGEMSSSGARFLPPACAFPPLPFPLLLAATGVCEVGVSVAGVGGCDAFNLSLKPPGVAAPALPGVAAALGRGVWPCPPVCSLSLRLMATACLCAAWVASAMSRRCSYGEAVATSGVEKVWSFSHVMQQG